MTNQNIATILAPTNAFAAQAQLKAVPYEEWAAIPEFKFNRGTEERYNEKKNVHLRGKLTFVGQVIVHMLVDAEGNPVCRLDGNSRSKAWAAEQLQRPEFVFAFIHPMMEGEDVSSARIEALFDTINSTLSGITPTERMSADKKRLEAVYTITSGLMMHKNAGLTAWKEAVKNTKGNSSKQGRINIDTSLSVAKMKMSDFYKCNLLVTILADALDMPAPNKKDEQHGDTTKHYTAMQVELMLCLLANSETRTKAYAFFSRWNSKETDPVIAGLWEETKAFVLSGSQPKLEARTTTIDAFDAWEPTAEALKEASDMIEMLRDEYRPQLGLPSKADEQLAKEKEEFLTETKAGFEQACKASDVATKEYQNLQEEMLQALNDEGRPFDNDRLLAARTKMNQCEEQKEAALEAYKDKQREWKERNTQEA